MTTIYIETSGEPQQFSDSESFEQASKAALELPDDKKRELAWRLFDAVGISVVVGLDVDDFVGNHPTIARDKIIAVLGAVAEMDWSDAASAVSAAVIERLEQLEPANG